MSSWDSGRISSSIAKAPSSLPSATTERTVFPSDAQAVVTFSTSGGTTTLSSVNRRGPPIMTLLPFTNAFAPRPGSASKSAACNVGRFRRLAHAPVPGSSQPERDANHCVAELRSATVMLGIFGAENMANSGYELARKRSSNEEASHHRPDRLRRDHPDECYRQCLHPLHL